MSSGIHAFRFSLTTMFGMVLFAAFGTAAIRFASPFWAGITMAVTVPILFAAILGALFRLGQARAFWTGMAVCGWGYLIVVLAPWFEAGVGQHLPTSYLLSYAHDRLAQLASGEPVAVLDGQTLYARDFVIQSSGSTPGSPTMARSVIRTYKGPGQTVTVSTTGPDHSLVLRTGHALFALLFGFIGGVTARWFYLTRSPREDGRSHG
jgi:hypothetical protein